MNNNKNLYAKLIPVMLCFFARLASQCLPLTGLFLVPDFLRTYGCSDE